jgi:hypothetical protein
LWAPYNFSRGARRSYRRNEQTNKASYITTFATRAHNVRPEN